MIITVIGRLSAIAICLFALFQLSLSVPAWSQFDSGRQAASTPGAVVLGDEELFVIKAKLGPYSPNARAKNVMDKLERLVQDPNFQPNSISAVESEGETDIIAGDIIITSVTDADAALVPLTRVELAQSYVKDLRLALAKHKARRSIENALEDASASNFTKSFLYLLLEPLTLKILISVIGIAAISVVMTVFRKSAAHYIKDSSRRYALKKIVTFIGYFVAMIFVTVVFQDTLGKFAVIIGAATAGIAFALKEVIVSVAGWVAITFGDFYKVGDRIQLAGIKGDVIDIGFGRTTLMELGEWVKGDLYTGRVARVSNSFVFSAPFFNYSGDFPFLWEECVLPVKYGSDFKLAREIFQRVAQEVSEDFTDEVSMYWQQFEKKYLVENAQTSPMVTLVLNDNWMEFTVRYVVNYKRRRLTKDRLFTRIMEEIDACDGRVALASATVHLVEAPVIDVRVKKDGQ